MIISPTDYTITVSDGQYPTIDLSGIMKGEVNLDNNIDKESIIRELMDRLSAKPIVQHKCHNCGAQVEFNADKHIFVCPYCSSVYLIGTNMVNDYV